MFPRTSQLVIGRVWPLCFSAPAVFPAFCLFFYLFSQPCFAFIFSCCLWSLSFFLLGKPIIISAITASTRASSKLPALFVLQLQLLAACVPFTSINDGPLSSLPGSLVMCLFTSLLLLYLHVQSVHCLLVLLLELLLLLAASNLQLVAMF